MTGLRRTTVVLTGFGYVEYTVEFNDEGTAKMFINDALAGFRTAKIKGIDAYDANGKYLGLWP